MPRSFLVDRNLEVCFLVQGTFDRRVVHLNSAPCEVSYCKEVVHWRQQLLTRLPCCVGHWELLLPSLKILSLCLNTQKLLSFSTNHQSAEFGSSKHDLRLLQSSCLNLFLELRLEPILCPFITLSFSHPAWLLTS